MSCRKNSLSVLDAFSVERPAEVTGTTVNALLRKLLELSLPLKSVGRSSKAASEICTCSNNSAEISDLSLGKLESLRDC